MAVDASNLMENVNSLVHTLLLGVCTRLFAFSIRVDAATSVEVPIAYFGYFCPGIDSLTWRAWTFFVRKHMKKSHIPHA